MNSSNDQQTSVVLQPLVPTSSLWIRRPHLDDRETVSPMYRISDAAADLPWPPPPPKTGPSLPTVVELKGEGGREGGGGGREGKDVVVVVTFTPSSKTPTKKRKKGPQF